MCKFLIFTNESIGPPLHQQGIRGLVPPQLLHLVTFSARPPQNAEHEEPGTLFTDVMTHEMPDI